MSGTENILSRIARLEEIEVAEHVHISLIFKKLEKSGVILEIEGSVRQE